MKIAKNDNPYKIIKNIVLDKYGSRGESILVELKTKYSCDDEYVSFSSLLLNDGEDWLNPDWIWEDDWWEGEQDVELVAAAPVGDIKLSEEWRI